MSISRCTFIFLILSSPFIYSLNRHISIKEQEKVLQALVEKEFFCSLDAETMTLYHNALKEKKAVLKYILSHEIGFF